ncbi:MAG: ComEA family DNA-binding protein [Gammaproteobacteria bacterium]|nr:ComEA family DNA-binding protein [Gammaproteobacteria bacterium]
MHSNRFSRLLAALIFALAVSISADEVPDAPMWVDINTADAATIAQTLIGVGPSKAEAIVAYRERNGRFTDPYELTYVKGIGESTVEKNEARIKLK